MNSARSGERASSETSLRKHHHHRDAGQIDTPMSESANIALLEKIVAAQREIIAESISTNLAGAAAYGRFTRKCRILREGNACSRRRDIAVVRRQLGKTSADCRRGRGEAQRRRGGLLSF